MGGALLGKITDFEAATTSFPPTVQIGVLSSLAEDFD